MKSFKRTPLFDTAVYISFALVVMIGAGLIGRYTDFIKETTEPRADFVSVGNMIDYDVPADGTVKEQGVLVIDPGHGGEDGGAAGDGGILEKDLNLSVSKDIAAYCLVFGIPEKMTRNDDRLLYDEYNELEDYTGHMKSYDLKNRVKVAEDCEASLFLSIHMNKFTDGKYKGAQVYYSPNDPDSEAIAKIVQTYIRNHLQNDNEREVKKATSSIYVLNKLKLPAILVECGFLSSAEETEKLMTPIYRAELSASVFVPILEYMVRSEI